MNRTFPIVALALAFALPASAQSTTRPSTQPLTLQQEREKNKKSAEEEFSHLETLPARPINEIFSLVLDHDQLVLIPKLAPTNNEPKRIEITDFPGLASVTVGTDKDAKNQINSMKLQHYSFTGTGVRVKITQLLAPPQSLQIAQGIDAESYSVDVSLMRQADDPIDPNSKIVTSLYVTKFAPDDGDVVAKLSLKAPSFTALRQQYPRETQAYLVPILRDLHQMQVLQIDALVAQQVLGGKPKASDELVKKIKPILAKLDSDQFTEREAAKKQLQQLGAQAALYLRDADRSGWSQEQINGVDAFLASFSTIPDEEAQKLAKSSAFLLDVLYSDDAGLRQRAIDQLKKISPGKTIEFDQNAPVEKRYDEIDHLSRELLGPPATQVTTEKPISYDGRE